jgi:hypothetical protein
VRLVRVGHPLPKEGQALRRHEGEGPEVRRPDARRSGRRLRENAARRPSDEAPSQGQAHDLDEAVVSALFVRACRLGNASACTNAAAGRAKALEALDPCSIRPVRRVWDLGADPWACTMSAAEMVKNIRTAEDEAKVRNLVDAGCRFGPADPACEAATRLLDKLDQRRPSPAGPAAP